MVWNGAALCRRKFNGRLVIASVFAAGTARVQPSAGCAACACRLGVLLLPPRLPPACRRNALPSLRWRLAAACTDSWQQLALTAGSSLRWRLAAACACSWRWWLTLAAGS
eukprot:365235-Chlamydomonas_euryale.AAC.7